MHATILARWLGDRKVITHAARAAALVRVVGALLMGGKLSLTHLGRCLGGAALVKHQIKAVDRLLGNRHLQRERDGIYRAIAKTLLSGHRRPVIIVDWSDVGIDREFVMLKAAVPVGGRAISLYERVFPLKRLGTASAHREFLHSLRTILPRDCRPIVVTDAGFRVPWFREVESLGWDWVGRLRTKIKFYSAVTERWSFIRSLYAQASTVPRFVGDVWLALRERHPLRLYLVRARKPQRGRPHKRRGRKKPDERLRRRLAREPWLLATSLPHEAGSARRITKIYAQRMQIEETFRDLKSHRWGFGLRYACCHSAKRLEVLLMLGTLGALVAWLVGLAGRAMNWNWALQANTVRKRAVLSTFFIGRQLLARARADTQLSPSLLRLAFAALQRALVTVLPT